MHCQGPGGGQAAQRARAIHLPGVNDEVREAVYLPNCQARQPCWIEKSWLLPLPVCPKPPFLLCKCRGDLLQVPGTLSSGWPHSLDPPTRVSLSLPSTCVRTGGLCALGHGDWHICCPVPGGVTSTRGKQWRTQILSLPLRTLPKVKKKGGAGAIEILSMKQGCKGSCEEEVNECKIRAVSGT